MTLSLGGTAAVSDPGRRRRHNEDAYVCEPPLFAVADGIGGAQAGELASSLAAAAVRDDSSNGGTDGRGSSETQGHCSYLSSVSPTRTTSPELRRFGRVSRIPLR